jgi:predicted secreted protein
MSEAKEIRAVQLGRKLTIELEAMPGAGYMWELSGQAEALELVSQKVVSISRGIGGSSTQRFVFIARQTGNYALVFQLKRKWEKEPVKISEFSIQVK